jgi:hypothetical protein
MHHSTGAPAQQDVGLDRGGRPSAPKRLRPRLVTARRRPPEGLRGRQVVNNKLEELVVPYMPINDENSPKPAQDGGFYDVAHDPVVCLRADGERTPERKVVVR